MMTSSPLRDRRNIQPPLDMLARFEQAAENCQDTVAQVERKHASQLESARLDKDRKIEALSDKQAEQDEKSRAEHDRKLKAAKADARARIKEEVKKEWQYLDETLVRADKVKQLISLAGLTDWKHAKKAPLFDFALPPPFNSFGSAKPYKGRSLETQKHALNKQIDQFVALCERYHSLSKRRETWKRRIAVLVAALAILIFAIVLALT